VAIGGDLIPKKPSDHVQIVRFEMQEKEREMIESALLTWQFAKAGNTASQMVEAFDKLLSLENAYLLVTMYEIYTGKEVLPGTPNDIYTLIEWVKSWWVEQGEGDYDMLKQTGFNLFDFFRLTFDYGIKKGSEGFGG